MHAVKRAVTSTSASVVVVIALLAANTACVASPGGDDVTYADVAPLFAKSCIECHHASALEDGRPSLATYESAVEHAEVALLLAEAGLMPPSSLDRSGDCGELLGPKPLDDDELALLRAWIESGKPRGASARHSSEVVAERAASAAAGTVDVNLPLSAFDGDEQRCFVVDLGADLADSAALTGVRIERAGPVHHAMVFTVDDDSAQATFNEDGWPCPGTPGVDGARLAFAWVPGRATSEFPDGHGVKLSRSVVIQLHESGPDVSAAGSVDVELLVRDDARPLDVVTLAIAGFTLPPAVDDFAIARTVALPVGGRVVAAMPHMHALGRSLALNLDDESAQCVVASRAWRYSFQELALFAAPPALSSGTRLSLECAFDTSSRSVPTSWGESSDDEMCTVSLFMARD